MFLSGPLSHLYLKFHSLLQSSWSNKYKLCYQQYVLPVLFSVTDIFGGPLGPGYPACSDCLKFPLHLPTSKSLWSLSEICQWTHSEWGSLSCRNEGLLGISVSQILICQMPPLSFFCFSHTASLPVQLSILRLGWLILYRLIEISCQQLL